MIFARNYNSYELEKLDINGNLIENYGTIGKVGFFEVYNDCIYYLDESLLYKIDIATKNKQLINNNSSYKLNPVIYNNNLFYNTRKQFIVNRNTNMSIGGFGDLCSISLESGEFNKISTLSLCYLINIYNDIIYCREFIIGGNLGEFQINIDGTEGKSVKLF